MRTGLAAILMLASLFVSAMALAQQEDSDSALPRLGLAPAEPQTRNPPPSVPFGIKPSESKTDVLDFHGFLWLPLRVGVLERPNPRPGESSIVLHNPPLIPQHLRSFEYVGVVPDPWVQLNFIYGNSTVSATAILAARAFPDAAGYYNPVDQLGVNDAFLTVNLSKALAMPLEVKVGAMTGRYGPMGAYDAGRYGTPLIARVNAIGEMITAGYKLGATTFVIEQGLGGQLGRPPAGLVPAGWNDFASGNVGASFVNHVHAGASYAGLAQLGLHYLTSWSQDDQIPSGLVPNGRITVFGADARLTAGRYGHLYAGVARTLATNAATVSGVIEILNARGGPELISEYLGPASGGDGSLTTFGAQYDLSLVRLMFDELYTGKSPDLRISLFGVGTKVRSDDPDYDGVLKLKGGTEVTYSLLSWFGVSTRFDHVRLDADNSGKAFSIVSPRLLFHTGWLSRDEFALQYSHFISGSRVDARTGYPPLPDPTRNPDRHVLSFSGTFWW
jgi:hypothetical protein